MSVRARHPLLAAFFPALMAVAMSSAAAADGGLPAHARAALASNDCAALADARRQLPAPGWQSDQAGDTDQAGVRVLADQLTDAMLAIPDCGRMDMQLMRSRTLHGDAPGKDGLFDPEPRR